MLSSFPEIKASLVDKSDYKINSMKTIKWKCTNKGCSKTWDEIIKKRMSYRWCLDCSPRSRDGLKCQKCEKRATFNYKGEHGGAFCKEHSNSKMVDVKNITCIYSGCTTQPAYNLPGQTKSLYCVKHKSQTMINVKSKKCIYPSCTTQPIYNFPTKTIPSYCSKHKKSGMINVRDKKCAYLRCNTIPNYNFKGKVNGLYCLKHKKDKMINVKHNKCVYPGCIIQPSYNSKGKTVGLYCLKHKKSGMINVRDKRCIHPGCDIRANYNTIGETKLYCSKHKKDEMVDVINNKCAHRGCNIRPNYNFSGKSKGMYCSTHKTSGMIDVKNRTCIYLGCRIHPSCNFPHEIRGIYCSMHKKDGMINVKDRRCEYSNEDQNSTCLTLASFGKIGHQPSRCATHIEDGMVYKPTKRCTYPKCKDYATMGTRDSHGDYCETHAPEGYISLLRYKCKGCSLPSIVDKDGYCVTCHPETITRYRLAKQRQVVSFLSSDPLTSDFTTVDVVLEQTNNCKGSKKYRPDITYQRDEGYFIIVEVDENQHNTDNYQKCDLPRMINLHQDIGAPVYFIRYNPDPYKKGSKRYNPTDHSRRKLLTKWIKEAKGYGEQNLVTEGLHVLYLFYDDYKDVDGWKTIDYFRNLDDK